MPQASYEQSAFSGGEVSPLAQGRADQPWYRQAMSLSLNGQVIEEGAWVRRSGTEFIAPTRGRVYARMISFNGSATCSFGMVFTAPPGGTPPSGSTGNLQFVAQDQLVFDNTVATISSSTNPDGTAVTINTVSAPAETWNQGDQVMLVFPDVSSLLYPYPIADEVGLRNRLLTIGTVISTTEYTLDNDLSVNLATDGSVASGAGYPAGALAGAQIMRVFNLATPYIQGQAQLQALRAVQIEYQSVILSQGIAPYVVQITTQGTLTTDPVFSITALTMIDGPYLDAYVDDGSTISGTSGTITFSSPSYTFVSTDVGRSVRIFTQPALWVSSTTYAQGDNVTDTSGAWWTSLISGNTGNVPGQPATVAGVQQLVWAPAPQAGSWAWGPVGSISGGNAVITLDTSIPNMVLQPANGTNVALWQLGVFTTTPQPGSITATYPTAGLWVQGRLLLAGAIANRLDTTVSNGVVNGVATFSPTDPWDNVLDNSGMSLVLNNSYLNQIQWMVSEDSGIVCGTLSGEILIFASETNDPLTPTNIDTRLITQFGSAAVDPVRAGMGTIFVQKYGRRAIEYLADAFSGKFSGRHLNQWSKHLSGSGIARLAYQEETVPTVWAMMNNGLLASCTYRRLSRFVNQPPDIAAWQRVLHGRQRSFTDLCVVPGKDGLLDRMFCVTNDPSAYGQPPISNYYIEIMQPLFDEGQTALTGWFCDQAPGFGVGNSGYDCGGGNASTFRQSGGLIGTDNTTPNVSNVAPFSDNGAAPAAGQPIGIALATTAATYFDGTVGLYGLPPFPVAGSPVDETSLSLSVWVASEDFPQQAGAMFCSPALTAAEAFGQGTIISSILGGDFNNDGTTAFAYCTTGTDEYPHGSALFTDGGVLVGGQIWNHVMVSMKTNGDGTATCTAAVNETVILSSVKLPLTGKTLANNNPGWPFAAQPDALKEIGPAVWCIGGSAAGFQDYTVTWQYASAGGPGTLAVPTSAQILQTLIQGQGLVSSKYLPAGLFVGRGDGAGGQNVYNTNGVLIALPAYQQYITVLNAQNNAIRAVNTGVGTYTGGINNLPADQPTGGYAGYRGSVAELLIWPGKFIDWTNAANRGALHYFNTIDDLYEPLSPGSNGGGTTLGQPYAYLSGAPEVVPINRATGKVLTVTGAGLIDSPLSPPGAPGS